MFTIELSGNHSGRLDSISERQGKPEIEGRGLGGELAKCQEDRVKWEHEKRTGLDKAGTRE